MRAETPLVGDSGVVVDVDAVATELYGLRPEEFTAARDAHVAGARKAGERAEAKRIAALRKPTLAVWAANLLARADADQARRLLQLGQELREAHRTLAGEDLRKLSHQQHVVIAAMAHEARRLAGEAGQEVSEAVEREVEQILRTVLADPDAAETWAGGVLAKAPPQVVGFDELAPVRVPGTAAPQAQPPSPSPKRRKADKADKAEKVDARVTEAQERARAEAERTNREAERAEEALARAEAEREQARAGLGALDEQIANLQEQLERAQQEHDRLGAAAEAADHRHQQAAQEAKAARTAARKARRALEVRDGITPRARRR
ncbi:hypothetical protein PV721_09260 [Streptomyces sp. MB09-01]|uniref:hypothetical protein n=1 Tax=Streptomyces sp. MB09-01 TaxID=3028666 RepID=UPI0029BA6A7C|nr:hypothetical protein [Streptomyces sp. MB09-01]MDX3534555.1 hypothetical protein [Streptomyces sp. MB09-01]